MNGKQTNKVKGKEALSILLKAIRFSASTKSKASIAVSIAGFAAAFLPTLVSGSLKNFSNLVQRSFGSGKEALPALFLSFAILSGFYILQLVYNSLRSYYTQADTVRIRLYIKEKIIRHTCTVRYKYLDNADDFRQRIRFAEGEAGYKVAESMGSVIGLLQYLITFVSIVAALSSVSVWIVLILFITCIPAVILAYLQNDEEYRGKTKWIWEFERSLEYYKEMNMPYVQNDVRFFRIIDHMMVLWREAKDIYLDKKTKLTQKHVRYNSVADLLRNSVYIVILLLTARRIFADPSIGIGSFMLVFTLASQFQETTAKILIGAVQFAGNVSYMKDFFDLDKLEHEGIDPNAEPYEKYDISMDGVSFTYPETDREVLKNISVRIKQGEKIAIVGENGSGKTTFINLLCGIYAPTQGEIRIGDHDLYEDLSRSRRTISAVFQEFGKYETSIRGNIAVSDPVKEPIDQTLVEITKQLDAYDFIAKQPRGFDEAVGTLSEKGNNLSGGQWQKIAIARGAFRDKANIMVLDEPTAALDPMAEANLYDNFKKLTGDRTTILISHRLGITRLVDRILVFDEGRIVEDGSHAELMAGNGLYAKMYNAQAQWYK